MNVIKNCFWVVVTLLCVSCSEVKSSRYQDTSHLEQPPKMEIVVRQKQETEGDEEIDKGLGNSVKLATSADGSVIKIKKLFNRSWNIVEQALKLNHIEVKDKNRELGVFYILFDPDEQKDREKSVIPSFAFSFFQDDYDKAAYKLLVTWKDSDTEITADLVEEDDVSDLLDDDEDEFENAADGSEILLSTLYKTIKHDLPLN